MTTRAEALLDEFAVAVAAAGPQPGIIKPGKLYHVHCPFPGPAADPHNATGDPQVYLWVNAGDVHAHCNKCLGNKASFGGNTTDLDEARSGFTDRLKELVGWQHEPTKHRKTKVLRTHQYLLRDITHVVYKDKIGPGKFWWRAAPLDANAKPTAKAEPITAEEFLLKHCPDYDKLYAALHWYGLENLDAAEHEHENLTICGLRFRHPFFAVPPPILCGGLRRREGCRYLQRADGGER